MDLCIGYFRFSPLSVKWINITRRLLIMKLLELLIFYLRYLKMSCLIEIFVFFTDIIEKSHYSLNII